MVGRPDGMERLGGIDIDAAILAFVDARLGGAVSALDADSADAQIAVARLKDECRVAKETLSGDTDTSIAVEIPGLQTRVRMTRTELDGILRPRLAETVEALERAVAGASLTMADVGRILLVGGSSRSPLVGEMLAVRTGRPLAVDAHPKYAVCLGAAIAGRAASAPSMPAPGVPAAPAAPVAAVLQASSAPPPRAPPPPPSPAAPAPTAAAARGMAAPFPSSAVVPPPAKRRGVLVGAVAVAVVVAIVVAVLASRGGSSVGTATTTSEARPTRTSIGASGNTAEPATDPAATTAAPTSSAATTPPTTTPSTTSPVPSTAAAPVLPPARDLSETGEYVGLRLTATKLELADARTPTDATVTVTFKVRNVGAFTLHIDMPFTIQIDGVDYPGGFVNGPAPGPGVTTLWTYTVSVPRSEVAKLDSAVVRIGTDASNQVVLPLGPKADPAVVVRHALVTTPLALDVVYGSGAPPQAGRLKITSVELGASTALNDPVPAGQVWLGLNYTVCLDPAPVGGEFFHLFLTLPDGTNVAGEYIDFINGSAANQAAVVNSCPDRITAAVYFAVDPAAVSGTTVTMTVSDLEGGGLTVPAGTFTVRVPVVAPNGQVPT